MTAVSQSYPNYLGGLNEQPDELKKPGQLVEALNVIPDPTVGLSRRPGFKLIEQSLVDNTENNINPDPEGTWFEVEYSNNVNQDFIYFGNVRQDGVVVIYNQDGVKQAVRYTEQNRSIPPHKNYEYDNNKLKVTDDNGDLIDIYEVEDGFNAATGLPETKNGYFKHNVNEPLKYCVSKNHIIFANPRETPTLSKGQTAGTDDKTRYYSFINLKVIDNLSYQYVFRLFGAANNIDTYRYITDIEAIQIDDVLGDYDTDLQLPLQVHGPYSFTLSDPNNSTITEDAEVRVTFTGQVVQLQSNTGGYRNEARYTWNTEIITPGKGYRKGDRFTIQLSADDIYGGPGNAPAGAQPLDFVFEVGDVNTTTGVANTNINPSTHSSSSASEILEGLADQFRLQTQISFDKVIVVGNGLYLESAQEFSVSTDEIGVADVMNSQKLQSTERQVSFDGGVTTFDLKNPEDDIVPIVRVNTVAELPLECYNGFVVEVINSFNNQNNYYLQYKSESDLSGNTTVNNNHTSGPIDITKSDGYWEEIARPFESNNPRDGTLPHMITIAKEANQQRFVFVVSPISYKKRTAGTFLDNPSMFRDRDSITAVNYYKNRLFFFTDAGSVISSRAGEIDNLFLNTAIDVSLTDPIDVIANSNQRVPIFGSAVVNNGMVLFGNTEQYMLTTNSDILTSSTANITKVSNYTYSKFSTPIYLGANIGFVSSGLTRFYEMTNLYERGPVDINERSQQVQSTFGNGFNMPASSREQSMVLVYKQGAVDKNMMIYRFRQESSQESSQTAWVKWDVDAPVAFASLPQDYVYLFITDTEPDPANNQGCKIYRMDSTSLSGIPASANSIPSVPKFTDGYTDTVDGTPFKTEIVFPTIYPRNGEVQDITSNTTIHRIKLSTAAIGTYNLEIKRDGYDTYDLLVEQTPADDDGFVASSPPDIGGVTLTIPPLRGEHIEIVPIYTRNKNLTITMSTEYDAPLTLRSMTWDGDWNPPYYKRV